MLFGKTLVIYCRRRRERNDKSHVELEELAEEHEEIEMEEIEHDKYSNEELKKEIVTHHKEEGI